MRHITVSDDLRSLKTLKAGEEVSLTGVIYTARDQAHARLAKIIASGGKLPFNLAGAIIYYCGPTETPAGSVIGSCGPTTSRRMDPFTPLLLDHGLTAMIGKGGRSPQVVASIRRHKAVYFVTYAGCGALLAGRVISKKLCAFPELGPEAVYRLEVKDFPLVTAIDGSGRLITKDFGV